LLRTISPPHYHGVSAEFCGLNCSSSGRPFMPHRSTLCRLYTNMGVTLLNTMPARNQPGASQEPASQDPAKQPARNQPGASQASQPGASQAASQEPARSQPGVCRPGSSQAASQEPTRNQPGASQASQPGASQAASQEPARIQPGCHQEPGGCRSKGVLTGPVHRLRTLVPVLWRMGITITNMCADIWANQSAHAPAAAAACVP
jgi:hypothetical protein